MGTPAVTVVVTAYRRLHYLREALASAQAQTFTDFELIVTDDSASDEIAALVASSGDARLRYRRNVPRLGIALNHYAGYQAARGRYLANLDDDDLWEPDFLAELVPPLEADPSVILAFCDHHVVDADGRLMREKTEATSRHFGRTELAPGRQADFLRLAVVRQAIPMAMGAVFRRSLLDAIEYPSRIAGTYDYWLAYAAARSGQAAYYVPRRLSRYRIHPSSGTATDGVRNLRSTIYLQRRFLADPRLATEQAYLHNNLGIYYGKLGLAFLRPGMRRRGWVLVREAYRHLRRWKNRLGLAKNCLARLVRNRAS